METNIIEKINDNIDKLINENNGEMSMSLHVLTLKDVVPFPGMLVNLSAIATEDAELLQKTATGQNYVFLTTDNENSGKIGVLAYIRQYAKISRFSNSIVLECVCRMEKKEPANTPQDPNTVVAEPVYEKPYDVLSGPVVKAYKRLITEAFSKYTESLDSFDSKISEKAAKIEDIGALCDYIGHNTDIPMDKKIQLLNETLPQKRAELTITILRNEVDINEYKTYINGMVKSKLMSEQREHFIREEIKQLKTEINDTTDDMATEYFDAVTAITAPEEIKDDLLDEVSRLYSLPESSQEFSVITSYLDVVLSLPWGTFSDDNINLDKARKILDKDHYGLAKVKDRILETLAVKKLTGKNVGQIICLVGPPGVGKTSVAESIARACGRTFQRISLGGVRDESEIRGHRRTYIASMPGQIINAIIHAHKMNPVILLDEIDKLGSDYKGDPTSALLEVLDPEQNKTFKDHFLDFPFDLSNVMFITTANVEENIPDPLRDRMDIIELPSYTHTEKINIAKKHLVRKQMQKNGLTAANVKIADSALDDILKYYTREAGVRTLEKTLNTVMRKIAKDVACDSSTPKVTVNSANLIRYLGPHKFKEDDLDKADRVGIVNGLAYTTVGGEMMEIEVKALEGNGKIELTGLLGDVMKESAKTAVSYIRSIASELGIEKDFYKTKDIHYHFPEGAVPKDGPSAGIGIALALISELTGRKVKGDHAMTGEITLRGRVLPIGGLREKTMAAYKSGIKTVIIPKENLSDIYELEDEVKEGLKFVPVETLSEVIEEALLPAEITEGK